MKIRRLVNVMVATCTAMLLLLLVGFAINFQNSRNAVTNNRFAEEIRVGVDELRFIMLETALYDVPRAREQWQSKHAAMRAILDRQFFDEQEARTLLQRIHDNHDTADVLYRRLAEARAPVSNAPATNGNSEVYERTLSTALLVTQEMGNDAREISRISQGDIVAAQQADETLTLITGLLVSAFAVWVWWLVRRRVLRPIVLVHKGANALTAGNLEHRVGLIGHDEIAELAVAFDHMAQRLQSSSAELNRTLDTIKQQKEALQESEESLAITLHSIGDAVIATDPAGRLTRMNATAERLSGWTLSEAMGRPLSEVLRIINADTREPVVDPVQLVMAHGQVVGLANHTVLLARDDHEYQIADSAAPIRNAIDEIVGVVLVFSDVTEKYRAEEALRMTRFSVDAASDALFWLTPDARIVDVNAAACRLLGYTREELLQLRVPDVDAHYNAEIWPQHFSELRQRGSMTFESEQRTKDGRLIPVEIVANHMVYASEERNCVFVRDITERKRAEKAQRENEERWKFAIEGSGDGVWDWNLQTGEATFSKRWKNMLGWAENEIGNSSEEWVKRVCPEDLPGVMANIQEHLDQKTAAAAVEFRMLTKDGSWKWILGRGIVVSRDADGKPLRLVGTNTDISESKQAEEALRRSEARFRNYFNQPLIGVAVTSPDKGWIEVNRRLCEMLGYPREELVQLTWAEITHPDDIAGDVAWFERVLGGEIDGYSLDKRFVRKDGTAIYVAMSASCVRTDDGRVDYFVALIEDISKRFQLEAQLRESQKMDALGTLAGGVAHDFNNALAAIIGNVELARQDVGPEHAALESLEEIGKASRRAKALVQQILAFGRRQTTERKVISLEPVVQEAAKFLRATIPAGVSLNVACVSDAPSVLADAVQIQQVLINLGGNAWHAIEGEERAGLIEIRMGAEVSGDLRFAVLTVRDNGRGMDEATRARVFEPFFTTKAVDKGTGLGLSVVYGIVQAHEADIEVHSTPGEGTAFVIRFPAAKPPAALVSEKDGEASVTDVGAPLALQSEGKRVLYVDDEESIVSLMTRLLGRRGYRVAGYTEPRKALEAVRANPDQFDLAVTDYNMPGMSGLEVALTLREIRADLPVILVSGYITEELQREAPAAGVRELIVKADAVEDVCEAVARYANAKIGKESSS